MLEKNKQAALAQGRDAFQGILGWSMQCRQNPAVCAKRDGWFCAGNHHTFGKSKPYGETIKEIRDYGRNMKSKRD